MIKKKKSVEGPLTVTLTIGILLDLIEKHGIRHDTEIVIAIDRETGISPKGVSFFEKENGELILVFYSNAVWIEDKLPLEQDNKNV